MDTSRHDKHAEQQPKNIIWIDYMEYKARVRGFDLAILEHILRHATERYYDTKTQRLVVIGRHRRALVLMAYEEDTETMTPVTVHEISRHQIRLRLKTGRLVYA
jgi:hypothetical protein